MVGVYLMNTIRGLAGAFVGIFVPIYLLSRELNPANVFWFYLVYSVGCLVFFFSAYWIVQKIGLRKTVLLEYPFLFLYFYLLYNFDTLHTPLAVIAIVSSFQASLYWFPLHMWLSETSKKEELGDQLGKFFALSGAIGIVAPFIAAFIIYWSGFKLLFVVACVIYLISAIPIFALPEFDFPDPVDVKRFWKLFKSYPHYAMMEVLENVREDAEAIIWPVFVYLTFKSVLTIGYIGTLSGVGGILFTYIVGKATDRVDKKKLMAAGAAIISVIWALRIFGVNQIWFYTLTLAFAFFEVLILIPINSIVYGIAKQEGPAEFIFYREWLVALGRIMLYIFALLVLANLRYIFVFAAVAGVGMVLLSPKNLEAKRQA